MNWHPQCRIKAGLSDIRPAENVEDAALAELGRLAHVEDVRADVLLDLGCTA